jgi:hypothetical protein
MRTLLLVLPLLTALCWAEESTWTGNINGFMGAKYLDKDDWEPVENQGAIGILFDTAPRHWPVALATNLMLSGDSDDDTVDTDGSTVELQVGVKGIFNLGAYTRLFVAGGPAIVTAYAKVDSGATDDDDDDSAIGGWLSAGIYWEIAEHFNLGALVTGSAAEVTLFDDDRKAGGLFVGVMAGYHW